MLHAPPISFFSILSPDQIIKLLIMQFSLLPCYLVPLLNTLFSTILSPCSFFIVSDQVSHPYKTAGII
jgi:hypothetical protein